MRIRTIKPEFWTDSFMVQLPPLARLIYIALWTAADDHGMLPDEPERLAMEVMPREDGIEFDDWFQFFEAAGRIEKMQGQDGVCFYRIAKWTDHQRVDKPSRSKIAREGSRKVAIPLRVRRQVAEKYGCPPGGVSEASCYYCGAAGKIHWHVLFSGRPSSWVTFPGLELDHLQAEVMGGETSSENIVLACRHCNRSKHDNSWVDHLHGVNSIPVPPHFARPRECSKEEQGTGNREQGSEKEIAQTSPALGLESSKPAPPPVALIPLVDGSDFAVLPDAVAELTRAFPAVNVSHELAKARSWSLANPKNRKTKNGVMRFLHSWMDRAQNSARLKPGASRLTVGYTDADYQEAP